MGANKNEEKNCRSYTSVSTLSLFFPTGCRRYYEDFCLKIKIPPSDANFSHTDLYMLIIDEDEDSSDGKIEKDKGIKINIPYKKIKGGNNYDAYKETLVVQDRKGKDTKIKLSYPKGSLKQQEGIIEALLETPDGDYYAPRPDEEKPLEDLATFKVTFNGKAKTEFNSKPKTDFKLLQFTGIKDKKYGNGDHDFIYGIAMGEDGRIWLNNNLGADYANVNHIAFDPLQQAKHGSDYHAFGSLFQQFRDSDGHELVKWTSDILPIRGSFAPFGEQSWTMSQNNNIRYPVNGEGTGNWSKSEPFHFYWSVNGENNPCPQGFRPPTIKEMEILYSVLPEYIHPKSVNSYSMLSPEKLKIPQSVFLKGLMFKRDAFRASFRLSFSDVGYTLFDIL